MLVKIWHLVLESNTFNFIVFVLIFAYIFKKIKLGEMIQKLQQNIENTINNSIKAKKDSEILLNNAEKQMETVDTDIDKIVNNAKKTAKTVAENIISSSKGQIEIIENNTQKIIFNDIYKVKRSLSDFTIKESIKLTKNDIETKLKQDKNLHQKYIDEAITELESIEI